MPQPNMQQMMKQAQMMQKRMAHLEEMMAAVNIDGEKIITSLNNLIQERQADPQDLTEFFSQARKALSTHQKVLDYEPEVIKPAIEGPRP